MRFVLGFVLVVALIAGGLYVYAGRLPGPAIEIARPTKYVGQTGAVEVAVTAPGAKLTRLQIAFEQNGRQTPLVSLAQPGSAEIKHEGADRVRITRAIGRDVIPDLKSGPPRILVPPEPPAVYRLRKVHSTASHALTVPLQHPPIPLIP